MAPEPTALREALTLADALIGTSWFNRRQAWRVGEHDESWCSLCKGKGGYHDYELDWHDADCPLRLACALLGIKSPLGISDRTRKRRLKGEKP